jgi:hypothetical protein
MSPKEIGAHLRACREEFLLSVQDVSERLHIRPRYLTALEEARFDDMPAPVYARGYLATYAEFLGLDAARVVQQCFAPPPAAPTASEAKPVAPEAKEEVKRAEAAPRPAAYTPKPLPQTLETLKAERPRWHWPLAALALVGIAAFSVLRAEKTPDAVREEPAARVAEVPENLLASVRSMVMPTGQNIDCLGGDLLLSCLFAQRDQRDFEALLATHEPVAIDMIAVNEALAAAYDEEAADD